MVSTLSCPRPWAVLTLKRFEIPMHLGSLMGVVEHVTCRHPVEEIREGDVFVGNDAYTGGGTHLPDIVMIERELGVTDDLNAHLLHQPNGQTADAPTATGSPAVAAPEAVLGTP